MQKVSRRAPASRVTVHSSFHTPVQVGVSGNTAISAGFNHNLALGPGGSVWAWGSNYDGELGDGTTLVWQRPGRGLVGRVKPVSAFRDAKGRICRTVVYALALGGYQREIDGVACREQDGSWSIAG